MTFDRRRLWRVVLLVFWIGLPWGVLAATAPQLGKHSSDGDLRSAERFVVLAGGHNSRAAIWELDPEADDPALIERFSLAGGVGNGQVEWLCDDAPASLITVTRTIPESGMRIGPVRLFHMDLGTWAPRVIMVSNVLVGHAATGGSALVYAGRAGKLGLWIADPNGRVRRSPWAFRRVYDFGRCWLMRSTRDTEGSRFHLLDPHQMAVLSSFRPPAGSKLGQGWPREVWLSGSNRYLAWLEVLTGNQICQLGPFGRVVKMAIHLLDTKTGIVRRLPVTILAAPGNGVPAHYSPLRSRFDGDRAFQFVSLVRDDADQSCERSPATAPELVTVQLPSLQTERCRFASWEELRKVFPYNPDPRYVGLSDSKKDSQLQAEAAAAFMRRHGVEAREPRWKKPVAWVPSGRYFLWHQRSLKCGETQRWSTPYFYLGDLENGRVVTIPVPVGLGSFPMLKGISIAK